MLLGEKRMSTGFYKIEKESTKWWWWYAVRMWYAVWSP